MYLGKSNNTAKQALKMYNRKKKRKLTTKQRKEREQRERNSITRTFHENNRVENSNASFNISPAEFFASTQDVPVRNKTIAKNHLLRNLVREDTSGQMAIYFICSEIDKVILYLGNQANSMHANMKVLVERYKKNACSDTEKLKLFHMIFGEKGDVIKIYRDIYKDKIDLDIGLCKMVRPILAPILLMNNITIQLDDVIDENNGGNDEQSNQITELKKKHKVCRDRIVHLVTQLENANSGCGTDAMAFTQQQLKNTEKTVEDIDKELRNIRKAKQVRYDEYVRQNTEEAKGLHVCMRVEGCKCFCGSILRSKRRSP